jgi:hypothetical protein
MKHIKKIMAMALVIVSVLTIAVPAMATAPDVTLTVGPGENPRTAGYTFSNGVASFTCACSRAGSDDTVRIFLDTYNSVRKDWYLQKSYNFTSNGTHTLSYTMGSNDTKARIRTYGYNENVGDATVSVYVND